MDNQTKELIRRKRTIQEAEGYLELAMVFDRMWDSDLELRSGLVRKSMDCLNRVNQANSRLAEMSYLTGCALKVDGFYQEAIEHLDQSLAYDENSIDALMAIAYCYRRTGEVDRAIESLERALTVDPKHPIVHYNLACYFAIDRNVDAAAGHLSRAVGLNPKLIHEIRKETDFDGIRNHSQFRQFLKTMRLDRPVPH